MVQAEKQQSYLLNKFTNVKLENVKRIFKIDWPYIYTLNIDDAIEIIVSLKRCYMPIETLEIQFLNRRSV